MIVPFAQIQIKISLSREKYEGVFVLKSYLSPLKGNTIYLYIHECTVFWDLGGEKPNYLTCHGYFEHVNEFLFQL